MKKETALKIALINIIVLTILSGIALSVFFTAQNKKIKTKLNSNIYKEHCLLEQDSEFHYLRLKPNNTCSGTITKNDKIIKKLKITIDENGYRKTSNKSEFKGSPIIFFGCSYTFGYGLNDNETFPWLISKLTKRKTYNIAYHGYGPQHMLLALKSKEIKTKVPKADTIVYIFISDHVVRPLGHSYMDDLYYPMYKLEKGKLLYYTTPEYIINSPEKFEAYKLARYKFSENTDKESEYVLNLTSAIIKESKDIALKKYPNARFIFFDLNNMEKIDSKIKAQGIEVIRLKDIFGEESIGQKYYTIDHHPNAEFWKKVTPKFIEKAGL